jgi:two-component system invasion response regulator UvrY
MKVLIADDHPIVRSGLKQILSAEDDLVVVGEAENGSETLELARKLDWDILVLDYSMPGRSGLELIKEIKRQYPDRPVLVLSMMPEEVHAAQVYKAGGAGFVKKERQRGTDDCRPQGREGWQVRQSDLCRKARLRARVESFRQAAS